MKYIITGPRSVGKTTTSKLLAKKLNLEYISSDDEMDVILKEYGGIDGATKSEMMSLIIDKARTLVKKILKKNNFIFDLAGGVLRKKYYNNILKEIKKQTILIGLIPSTDDKKTIQILYHRERKRPHFNDLSDEKLLAKTKKDYLKIKEALHTECKINIITENKTTGKIVDEIISKLN